jgi:hypothetical protein
LDFDRIEKGAEQKMPKYMEWYGAMGLMITTTSNFKITQTEQKLMVVKENLPIGKVFCLSSFSKAI